MTPNEEPTTGMDGPNTHKMDAPSDVTSWTVIATTRNVVADDGRNMTLRDEWWHVPTFVIDAIEARATATPGLDVPCTCRPFFNGHVTEHPDCPRGRAEARATATPGLREALSDAVKRAGVYEIADAMVWAILDGTFADSSEDQVRHAVYELVGRAALDAATPGLDVERLASAAKRAIAMAHFMGDQAVHYTPDWTECDAPVCVEVRAALSASGETDR